MIVRSVLALLLFFSSVESASAASIAGSQCASMLASFQCFAQGIGNILMYGTGILVGVAIVFYFYGIVLRLWGAQDGGATGLNKLRGQLLWGLLALFVILSIWGILSLLGNLLFGTNNFNSLF